MEPAPETLTLLEAARRAGISQETARQWVVRHGIGHKVGHAWRVNATQFETMMKVTPRRGRPRHEPV